MEILARARAIMPTSDWKRRLVPLGLGAAMLATVIAAALTPNIGAVPAQSSCQYGTCSSGTSTPFPWWIVAVVVVIVAALVLAYLLVGRRRRPPARGLRPAEAAVPPSGAAGGGPEAPGGPAAAAYVETPEDVGAAMPSVAGVAGGAAGAGAAAGAPEEEPDIDALMAELDKISGEILKKPPKTGGGGSAEGEATEESGK
jgi:hypothetical protein